MSDWRGQRVTINGNTFNENDLQFKDDLQAMDLKTRLWFASFTPYQLSLLAKKYTGKLYEDLQHIMSQKHLIDPETRWEISLKAALEFTFFIEGYTVRKLRSAARRQNIEHGEVRRILTILRNNFLDQNGDEFNLESDKTTSELIPEEAQEKIKELKSNWKNPDGSKYQNI